jgi:steroid 5-alpha reductase family enzyme
MKLKENKTFSLLIIIAVYVVATAIGFICFNLFETISNLFLQILVADAIATAVVFIFSLILNNSSVYDPYWSVQPIVICYAFAFGKKELSIAVVLLLVLVSAWGIRLTLNWVYTFKNLNHQDWRYDMLKEKTGVFYPLVNFLGIHLFPTVVVWAFTMPVVYAIIRNLPFNMSGLPFLCVSALAIFLQSISDAQMHRYRKNRLTTFINTGLWSYSRHPNYLGEILMWWGVALFIITLEAGLWHFAIGALVNHLMFIFVSIPMAEGKQSKKDGYAEYKRQTRALLPIYKKVK